MGYTTTVLIRNDGLDQLAAHPEDFTAALVTACRSLYGGALSVGYAANPVEVMPPAHADTFHLYATHANAIVELSPSAATVGLYQRAPEVVTELIETAKAELARLEAFLAHVESP